MSIAPKTRILVAITVDSEDDRLRRVLDGHDLRSVRTCVEANSLLQAERFGMVIVGVHFDESQMFTLLADIRAHAKYRKVPILCVLGNLGRVLTDDEEGNARIRRIVDHMIIIDGDLQHIARATGEPVPLHKERRKTSNGAQ